MQAYQQKLNIVSNHFKDGDLPLGFRKLVDCVLDTQNKDFYRDCIAFTDWKESEERTDDDIKIRAFKLLEKLSQAVVKIDENKNPLLIAENLRKEYGRKFKLANISMNIHRGDVWGLVGENGNGKTTLLRILAKDLKFDAGTLHYNIDQKEDSSDYETRTKLTYIPQRTPKWYGSLKSNLKFAASHYGIKGEENELTVLMWIIRFGLWKFRDHNWDELSSGYKMRFELARTFLRTPKILLLDEPLANLDVLAQQLILEDLKNLSQSLSNPLGIILSSQQLFEVEKVSDKVLFLKNGTPTHLSSANDEEQQMTVVELDILSSREELNLALESLQVHDIKFNGGMYVISLHGAEGFNPLLSSLISHQIKIKYVRDISQSTRRLFV